MDDEININFRPYIEILIRRWRLVVGAPIIVMVVTLVLVLLFLPPVYEANVFVAVAKQKVEVQFGTQIQTLTEEQLTVSSTQAQASRDARLATFRELVANPAIAEKVLPQFTERLRAVDEDLLDTSRFLEDHISVDQNTKSDLIGIVISLPDPALAGEIADAWAQAYETHINNLYASAQPADARAIGAQTEESRQTYVTAQEKFESYLANNPAPRLAKQINILQAQIDSYQTALVDTETLVNSRELATRRQLLSGYYADLVTLEKLLNDARMLQEQIRDNDTSPAAAFGDALAMIFIRSYTFAGTRSQSSQSSSDGGTQSNTQSSAPFSLQLQTPLSAQPVTSSDVEGLIRALEQRKKDTKTTISTLTATLLTPPQHTPPTGAGAQIKAQIEKWTTEIQSLQAQLEAESAHREDLERERNLALSTYSQLAKKTAEVEVAAQSAGTEVRVASKALAPTEPVSSRKLLIIALAGLGSFILVVLAIFTIEWWQKGKQEQNPEPAQSAKRKA